NSMGGIEAIRVHDDGHGMTYERAVADFTHLGGSWKRLAGRSNTRNRPLHGQAGQGRWRAFGVNAQVATWETVAEKDDENQLTRIEINRESLGNVEVHGPQPTRTASGTTVILSGINEPPRGLDTEAAVERLTAVFALHIE